MRILLAIVLGLLMFSCDKPKESKQDAFVAERKVSLKPVEGEAQTINTTAPVTAISFEKSEFNFGEVKQGEVVTHTYTFTNSGDHDLMISDAKASCGCTVPKWPEKPISPGETGEIVVKFSSAGRKGNQTKAITITANTTPPDTRLMLKGVVLE